MVNRVVTSNMSFIITTNSIKTSCCFGLVAEVCDFRWNRSLVDIDNCSNCSGQRGFDIGLWCPWWCCLCCSEVGSEAGTGLALGQKVSCWRSEAAGCWRGCGPAPSCSLVYVPGNSPLARCERNTCTEAPCCCSPASCTS